MYPDFATKASVLVHSLIRIHPFMDGNKRAGVMALEAFCMLNGYRLDCDDADLVALALDVAQGDIPVETIAGRVKKWLRKLVPSEWGGDELGHDAGREES